MQPAGPGKWRLRVYVGRDPATGNPRQVRRIFTGTETTARRALARLVTDVQDKKVTGNPVTVAVLFDRWLEHIEATRTPKTLHEYSSKIDKRIRPAVGGIRLEKLGAETLDRWYRQWGADGLSPTSVHHLHAILSAALNQAVRWGWIPSNPAQRGICATSEDCRQGNAHSA